MCLKINKPQVAPLGSHITFMILIDAFSVFVSQVLNPTEFFEGIVVEHDYLECTASTVHAFILFKKLYPEHRKKEIENSIAKAIEYIESLQMPDGSWYFPPVSF